MPKVGKKTRPPKVVRQGIYCRVCKKDRASTYFYEATNSMLDTNGYMSICRDCCNKLYDAYFSIYNNMEQALDFTCRDLDVKFSKSAIIQTQSHIESLLNKGKKADAVFGYYKSKLMSTVKQNDGLDGLRYKDSDYGEKQKVVFDVEKESVSISQDLEETITDEVLKYWGANKENWEYNFLENEIYRLKTDFECTDYGMEMIMRDICCINLDIEKIRQGLEKGDITKLIESRSKLMNDGNLKPIQSTGADKNEKMSLGMFIKKWEDTRPIKKQMDDEMKRYIDTYMVGHLAKMEGLNNDIVRKYEESIKDYTLDFNKIKSVEEDD